MLIAATAKYKPKFATLSLSGAQSIPNGGAHTNIILFDTVDYDPYGLFDPTQPGKLFPPANARFARGHAGLNFAPSATVSTRQIELELNGAAFAPVSELWIPGNNSATVGTRLFCSTPWFAVTGSSNFTGDYFNVYGWQDSGGALNVTNAAYTFFYLEFLT